MNCKQVEPLLTAHLLGDLDAATRQGVDEHLATCPACQSALAETRAALEPVQAALGARGQRHFLLDDSHRKTTRRLRLPPNIPIITLKIAATIILILTPIVIIVAMMMPIFKIGQVVGGDDHIVLQKSAPSPSGKLTGYQSTFGTYPSPDAKPTPAKPSSASESRKDWSIESYKLAMNGKVVTDHDRDGMLDGWGGGAGGFAAGAPPGGGKSDEFGEGKKQSPPGVIRRKEKREKDPGEDQTGSRADTIIAGRSFSGERLHEAEAGGEFVGYSVAGVKSPIIQKGLYGSRTEGGRKQALAKHGGAAPAATTVEPGERKAPASPPPRGYDNYGAWSKGPAAESAPAEAPAVALTAPGKGVYSYSEKSEGTLPAAQVITAPDDTITVLALPKAKTISGTSGEEIQSQNVVGYLRLSEQEGIERESAGRHGGRPSVVDKKPPSVPSGGSGSVPTVLTGGFCDAGAGGGIRPDAQQLEESQKAEEEKPGHKDMIKKLENIVIPEVEFRHANIADVVDFLNKVSQEGDKSGKEGEAKGINLTLAPEVEKSVINLGQDPSDPFADGATATNAVSRYDGDVTFTARYINMKQALDIITKVSGLKYRVDQNGITILGRDVEATENTRAEPPLSPQIFNPVILTKDNPFSTFAIDVDTASFTMARRSLLSGSMPPPEAIRVEEFVNAFEYAYPPPERRAFAVYTDIAPSPFRAGLQLLRVGVRGKVIGRDRRRNSVLTFVIDTSGSMNTPDRLGLVKTALRLLVENLDGRDSVAIVTFGSEPRLVLDQTPALKKTEILKALDAIQTYGSTHLEGGLGLGYETAARTFRSGAENRVLLLSDGVANLGAATAQEILSRVEAYRKQGIVCSVFGFGQGAYDDTMLETLADKGDGVYRFIDTPAEAQRVFVEDLSATLNTIAKDVKIQVEFDPARVASYRLLGYENRALTKEQFRDDTVDAGEIGSGQSATALYELTLADDAGSAPVPYRFEERALGIVRVRWADIDSGRVEELAHPVRFADRYPAFCDAPLRFRLAAGVAELAEVLRQSPYAGGTDKDDLLGVLRPIGLELVLDQKVQDLVRMANVLKK